MREYVEFYVVGSEGLFRGSDYTEQELLDAMRQVREATCLPVTTSEPWNVLVTHPDVIQALDLVAVNIYGFWEGAHEAQAALGVLQSHYNEVLPATGGKTVVVRAGRTFEKLAESRLDAGFMASPAVAGDSLILRTKTHLYRIDGE